MTFQEFFSIGRSRIEGDPWCTIRPECRAFEREEELKSEFSEELDSWRINGKSTRLVSPDLNGGNERCSVIPIQSCKNWL